MGSNLRELARLTGSHAGTLAREMEMLSALFRKTHSVAAMLREALAPVAAQIRVALLFGSLAHGTQTRTSDVDVLVVGDFDFGVLVHALHLLDGLRKLRVVNDSASAQWSLLLSQTR